MGSSSFRTWRWLCKKRVRPATRCGAHHQFAAFRSRGHLPSFAFSACRATPNGRIITSGDVTHALIAEGQRQVFLLGLERDLPLFDAECVGEADGNPWSAPVSSTDEDETKTPEDYTENADYAEMLKGFIVRNVPMICANPDLVVKRDERIISAPAPWPPNYEQLDSKVRIAGFIEASLAAKDDVDVFAKVSCPCHRRRYVDGCEGGAIASGLNLL